MPISPARAYGAFVSAFECLASHSGRTLPAWPSVLMFQIPSSLDFASHRWLWRREVRIDGRAGARGATKGKRKISHRSCVRALAEFQVSDHLLCWQNCSPHTPSASRGKREDDTKSNLYRVKTSAGMKRHRCTCSFRKALVFLLRPQMSAANVTFRPSCSCQVFGRLQCLMRNALHATQ